MLIPTSVSRVTRGRRPRGFTLIELVVTITLIGVLVALGLPSLMAWIRNAQVRAVADTLQSGVRRAQSEAVRLNKSVVLTLTNAEPALNATAVANGRNWSIQAIPSFADAAADTDFVAGGNLQDVSTTVSIVGPAALCFNANGRVVVPQAGKLLPPGAACGAGAQQYDIQSSTYDVTKGDRRLRVLVAIGGQVRMCDRDRPTLSATSPDGCP